MGRRILFAVIAAIASIVLVDSLTCNKCKYAVGGFCFLNSEMNCSTNTSVCFTGKVTFPSISSTLGFNTQGCREPANCNSTTNSTVLGVTFESKLDCCATDKCNPVQTSGAPTTKLTLSAAIIAAVLASVSGSMM